MLIVKPTKPFENSLKKLKKKHYDASELEKVIEMLRAEQSIPNKYRDHALCGNLKGFRECHLERNILLVYRKIEDILLLSDIGTHSDILGK